MERTTLPAPPYYAVIFTSKRNAVDNGYYALNDHLFGLAANHDGFLGLDSYREADGRGISIVYFRDLESLDAWRKHPEHNAAKARHTEWYDRHSVEVARVEKAYSWEKKP